MSTSSMVGNAIGLLTGVFVYLKLSGTVNWSWWWVLSPVWITVAAMAVTVLVFTTIFRSK